MIPKEYKFLIDYNPLANMILSWRDLFMNGVIDYQQVGMLYGYALLFIIIGVSIFNKLKYRFAEIL